MTSIFKKDGSFKETTKTVLRDMLAEPGCHYHGIESKGVGRFRHLSTWKYDVARQILLEFGISYVVSNDAPRGGKVGTYLSFSKSALVSKLLGGYRK